MRTVMFGVDLDVTQRKEAVCGALIKQTYMIVVSNSRKII